MKHFALVLLATSLSSCATLNESMTLGLGLGAAAGGASMYAAEATSGRPVSTENVVLGAGIGIAVGLVTSYFTHQSVEERRQACMTDQTEMHFGDLPPSPFIFPKALPKKGAR